MEQLLAEKPEPQQGESVSVVLLWTGIAIGPLSWFLNLLGGFALAPLACATPGKWFLWLLAAAALAFTAVGMVLSIRCWKRVRYAPDPSLPSIESHPNQCNPSQSNQKAMAIAGIAISALAFIAILAQSVPNLILAGCE